MPRSFGFIPSLLAMCACVAFTSLAGAEFAPHPQATARYSRLPLSFEANGGQFDAQVRFLARGDGYTLFLTGSGAALNLRAPLNQPASAGAAIRLRLDGARTAAVVTGEQKLAGRVNYFIGNDPAQWRRGIETYGRVRYASVYPGVDLVYYGNQRQLEYDFVVAPGSSAKAIRLAVAGGRLSLDREGNLAVTGKSGRVFFRKPAIYQEEAGGERKSVQGGFVLAGPCRVRFSVGAYDHSKPLVIDPILTYATYLGGSGHDEANGIAVDGNGNAYITGETSSTDFPTTTGSYQGSHASTADGSYDVYVAKLNAAGTALVYATYLGGSAGDYGNAIAVDSAGAAYVTGTTYSTDFPVSTGAFQTKSAGQFSSIGSVFVSKISSDGTTLAYSTYLGGKGTKNGEGGHAIAVDSTGDAYVTGGTDSTDFPTTTGAYQTTNLASYGRNNAFVTEVNSGGTALVYSTYLGGSYADIGFGIAVDSTGSAYVTGQTQSNDFPFISGSFQSTNNGYSVGNPNGFVTKLNPAGSAPVYSTYLGGTGTNYGGDYGMAIALDSSGDAFVTGVAYSTDFPVTTGVIQSANNNTTKHGNAFVTEVNPGGTALIYSTYLGGSGSLNYGDNGSGIAVDASGNACVTGTAYSTDFPVTMGAYQTTNKGANNQNQTAFVTKLNPAGTALAYSTYLGGSGSDNASGIALDSSGNAYVAGTTYSSDFPATTGAFQTSRKGVTDAFVAELELSAETASNSTTTTVNASANPAVVNQSVIFTASVKSTASTARPSAGGTPIVTNTPTGTVVFSYQGWNGTISSPPEPVDSSGSASVTWSWTSITDGGIAITATYSGDSKFLPSTGTITETINGAPQTITFTPPATEAPGSGPLNLSSYASSSSGLGVSFNLVSGPATLNGSMLTFTGVGSVVVQATQGGNGSWAAATPVNATIKVSQGQQTITFTPPASVAYSTTAMDLSAYASASSGLGVTFSLTGGPATLNGSKLTFTGAGSVVVQATQGGNSSWAAATPVNATIKVTQGQQTITFTPPATVALSSGTLNLSSYASASSGLGVSFSLTSGPATIKGTMLTFTGVGSVVAQATQAGNSTWAAATPVNATIKVTQGQQTITFTPPSSVAYSTTAMSLSAYASASSGLAVAFSVVSGPATLKGTMLTFTGTGSVVVQATQAGNSSWLAATPVNATIKVNQAQQSITFTPPATASYGAGPLDLSSHASASSGLAVSLSLVSGPASLNGAKVTFTGTGKVVLQAAQAGNANFAAATPVKATITVQPGSQTIAFTPIATVNYGAAPINLATSATATSGLGVSFSLVSGPATLKGTSITITGVGKVIVQATQAGNSNWAAATPVNKTITVQPVPLTVTLKNASMVYGAAVPALTSYTLTGFVNGDSSSVVKGAPKITTTATSASAVGTYPINGAAGTLSAANYTFTFAAGVLTVQPAKLTVTANNLTMKKGATVPTLTYAMTGFVKADKQATATKGAPALSTTATSNSTTGSYPIVVKIGTLTSTNYSFTLVNGTLNVTK